MQITKETVLAKVQAVTDNKRAKHISPDFCLKREYSFEDFVLENKILDELIAEGKIKIGDTMVGVYYQVVE